MKYPTVTRCCSELQQGVSGCCRGGGGAALFGPGIRLSQSEPFHIIGQGYLLSGGSGGGGEALPANAKPTRWILHPPLHHPFHSSTSSLSPLLSSYPLHLSPHSPPPPSYSLPTSPSIFLLISSPRFFLSFFLLIGYALVRLFQLGRCGHVP